MVFSSCGAYWRGLGWVSRSGLRVKGKFSAYDAQRRFKIRNQPEMSSGQQKKCKCTDVLKGLISPSACPLFSRVCTPEHPVGPCMVSGEGACNAAYKYR
jgi:hydrogenase expression/formation protein HypD